VFKRSPDQPFHLLTMFVGHGKASDCFGLADQSENSPAQAEKSKGE